MEPLQHEKPFSQSAITVLPQAPKPFSLAAHADLDNPVPAARSMEPAPFEPEHSSVFEDMDRGHKIFLAAMRDSGGLLPYDSDNSLEDRVMRVHAEHARAITLMVTAGIKDIPGAQVEGNLSKIVQKGREWTASGLSITLPDNPGLTWELSFEGTQGTVGGAYSGAHATAEGANYTPLRHAAGRGNWLHSGGWSLQGRLEPGGLPLSDCRGGT